MMCEGAVYCEMYRDKKYCRRENCRSNDECECRHAARQCEVEQCALESKCIIYGVDTYGNEA